MLISSEVTADIGSMSPLDSRIEDLRASLDDLTIRYTDKHPEVRQLNEMIQHLEAKKAAEISRVRSDTSAGFTGMASSRVSLDQSSPSTKARRVTAVVVFDG